VSSAVKSPIPKISPLAGLPAPKEMLIDVARLDREYFERRPDLSDPNQMVSFGTSGHRGSPLHGTFTEAHILAITQAICDYRRADGPDGPLYLGKDTHAMSDPAQRTALEVSGGERRGHDHSARQRLHADTGDLAGHPRL
jgi:phosphoglucomutase